MTISIPQRSSRHKRTAHYLLAVLAGGGAAGLGIARRAEAVYDLNVAPRCRGLLANATGDEFEGVKETS